MSSLWGRRVAAIIAAGLSTTTSTVLGSNMYQAIHLKKKTLGEDRNLRSVFHVHEFENRHVMEGVSVALGLSIHHVFVETPDFGADPNRKKLHDKLNELFEDGKISRYEYHSIRQVNISLYHKEVVLEVKPMEKILEAIRIKHANRELYYKDPIKYASIAIDAETQIARAFYMNESPVGGLAHLLNAALEASLCILLHSARLEHPEHNIDVRDFGGHHLIHREEVEKISINDRFKSVISSLRVADDDDKKEQTPRLE